MPRGLSLLAAMLVVALLCLHVYAKQEESKDTCTKGEGRGRESASPKADTPFVCDFVEKQDFYERMGVSKDVDERSLKKAYRKLSLKYHPDKVKGKEDEKACSQSHFIAINKAYETLRCWRMSMKEIRVRLRRAHTTAWLPLRYLFSRNCYYCFDVCFHLCTYLKMKYIYM